jgi:hypothetical protein
MKFFRIITVLALVFSFFSCNKTELSSDEIIQGLKEALKVGAENSVNQADKTDGYYGNVLIKILFPQEAQIVADVVSAIPIVGQAYIDDVILKMNRAAENAADKAKPIFIDAILGINFSDAMSILKGSDDAATQYLRNSTSSQLKTAFKPDIQTALDQVGASSAWETVMTTYNTIQPGQPVNTDLADYTTGKAIDGLFVLIGQEEAKIRKDPAARITDILQRVFGGL